MRRRLFHCVLLLSLAASAAAAQQFARGWYRVVPEGEEFAVEFPEPNYRIRREVPFGSGVTLMPASFEVAYNGAHLSVLSFSKSEAGAPKTLDAFVKGFQSALGKGSLMEFESEAGLDGIKGRQYRLKLGDDDGAARLFETEKHFYVVLTYGDKEAAGVVRHFQESFSLNPSVPRVIAQVGDLSSGLTLSPKNPEPLWPVVGGSGLVFGTRPQPGGGPDIETPKTGGRVIVTGGVLNGKAVAKPQPVYPPIAKAARAQGVVTVQILVDEEGYVISAVAVSGHPLLQQAAVFAARRARFTPTTLSGQPVKVSGVVTYNFVLG